MAQQLEKSTQAISRNSSLGEASYLLAVVAAVLIWSTSFAATKIAYTTFAPFTLGVVRCMLATLVLLLVLVVKRQFIIPTPQDLVSLAIGGLFGITLYFALENVGLKLTTASNAALITGAFPALTTLLELIFYHTKISGVKALGIGLAIIGVYQIAEKSAGTPGGQLLLGNLLLIGSGIVWAFYSFSTRSVVKKYPLVVISFYQTLAGTVLFIPLALTERTQWQLPTLASLMAFLFLGIVCSAVAFLLYNYGLRKLSASSAAVLLNLMPVFGVIFSVLILKETIGISQLVGGLIVVAGVMLSVRQ
ncbi:MAG TPA: DMT family transporter [Desulfobacteria bacterium]|nr:DMT family transporter [Desulfobacteria bacterium]